MAVSVRLTVRAPRANQALRSTPPSPVNCTMSRVAVLVDAVADHLARARAGSPRSPSLQSCGRGTPSPSRSRLVASAPEQSWSIPSSGGSGAPGRIAGVRVVAVGRAPYAVGVGVALDLLAGDAGVGVVADGGVEPGAAVDLLGASVARDDVVGAAAAEERVDAAAAEEAVVAVPAVEADGQRHVGADGRDVVAAAEGEHHQPDPVLGAVDALEVGADRARDARSRAPRRRSG